jgi:hypothetical protein
MLGIGCPDRHVLPHATSLKFALTVTRAPSRESGFVLGAIFPVAIAGNE